MREILFRGKLPDGEWVVGYIVKGRCAYIITYENIHYMCVSVMGHASVDVLPVKPETIGQYTGLTDRNGKRIFEGDLVKGYNTFHHREERYIVCYKVIGFFFCENENEWHPDHIEEMRVIGNVHDNPELIGGKEDG